MNINRWNNEVLSAKGIKHKATAPKVTRNVGDLQQATLLDGTVVKRQDLIYVEGQGLVKCANTELHFVFEMPKTFKGWGLYCTCGSIAGVVGLNAYSKLASPTSTGKLIACIRLLATKNNVGVGVHADGSHE